MTYQPPHPVGDGSPSPVESFTRGRQAEESGDLATAYACYHAAVGSRENHPDWLYRLGCVCLKTTRFDEARSWFEAGLRLRPGDGRMLTNLGAALDRLGERDQALAAYQRAAFQEDAPAEAFHNLGALYAEEGRTEDAIRAFGEAVSRQPDADGYCSLGMVLMSTGDLVMALDNFERAVACDSRYTRGHYYTAICLLKKGRYKEALHRFDLVLSQESGLVRANFHRGVCLHKLEEFTSALAALSRAEAAFPEDGRIHFQLALTCDALGLSTDARRHYHQARLLRDETRDVDGLT